MRTHFAVGMLVAAWWTGMFGSKVIWVPDWDHLTVDLSLIKYLVYLYLQSNEAIYQQAHMGHNIYSRKYTTDATSPRCERGNDAKLKKQVQKVAIKSKRQYERRDGIGVSDSSFRR